MDDIKNIQIEKLEDRLKVSPKDVAEIMGLTVKNIYPTYRIKKVEIYKAMIIGIRVMRSNLTIKEFLISLEHDEALKGKN